MKFLPKKKKIAMYRVRFDGWLYLAGAHTFTPDSGKALTYSSLTDAADHAFRFNHDGDCVIIENKNGRTNFISLDEVI